MHDIVEPLKPDHATRHPVSRRALLEGSASAGLAAAAVGWGSAALRPGDANAADASPRQQALPHNHAGEVDAEAFATFVSVLSSGDPDGFETIPRHPNAAVDLNDPQATYAFDLVGLDAAATHLDPPPAFASAQMATDMAEVYWRSLTRDVPSRDYETHPLVAAAVTDL